MRKPGRRTECIKGAVRSGVGHVTLGVNEPPQGWQSEHAGHVSTQRSLITD